MRIPKIFTLTCLIISSALFADTIRSIEVQGTRRFSKETVLTYAALTEGDDFNEKDVSQVITNLFQTDFFDDINVEFIPKEEKLIITVKEKPVLVQVDFFGNVAMSRAEFDRAFTENKIDKGRTYNERQVQKTIRELIEMYANDGYYQAEIIPRLKDAGEGKVTLKLDINEGPSARIYEINFHGNQSIPSDVLRKNINLKATNMLSMLTSSDKFSDVKLQQDLYLLQCYYRENGYPHIKIIDKKIALTTERKGLILDIFLDEGPRQVIVAIKRDGADFIEFNSNDVPSLPIVYNQTVLDEYEKKLKDTLNIQGYIYGEVQQDLIPISDTEVELRFKIKPGDLFRIEKYNFTGNKITHNRILRNFIRRPEGCVYSSTDLKELNDDLNRTGLFKDVQINPQKISHNEVAINISVDEVKTKKLYATAGVSNIGWMWNLGAEDINVVGSGTKVAVKFERDNDDRVLHFGISNPYFTHKNIEAFFHIDRIKREYDGKYLLLKEHKDIYSTTIGLNWSLSAHTKFGISGNYFVEKMKDATSAYADPNQQNLAHYVFFGTKMFRNRFNRYILPDDGYRWELYNNISTPLGNYTFTDTGLSYQYYVPLSKTGFIFYQGINFRMIYPYGSSPKKNLPNSRLLTCGGSQDIRGYHFSSVGPELEIVNPASGSSSYKIIEGNIKLSVRSEMILPNSMFNINYDQIRFSLFVDAAQMWRTFPIPQSYITGTNSANVYYPAEGLRLTTGVAMRFVSQILPPLSFSLNYPLIHKQRDKFKYEYFSFGTQMEF